MADYKFQGWLGYSPKAAEGEMKWDTYEPKKWTENDVDIKITHCGICGSDTHTLTSGWGATDYRTPTFASISPRLRVPGSC